MPGRRGRCGRPSRRRSRPAGHGHVGPGPAGRPAAAGRREVLAGDVLVAGAAGQADAQYRDRLPAAGHRTGGRLAGHLLRPRHHRCRGPVRPVGQPAERAQRPVLQALAGPGLRRRGHRLRRPRHPGRASLPGRSLRRAQRRRHGAGRPFRRAGPLVQVGRDGPVPGRPGDDVHREPGDLVRAGARLPRRRRHRGAVEHREPAAARRPGVPEAAAQGHHRVHRQRARRPACGPTGRRRRLVPEPARTHHPRRRREQHLLRGGP